MKAPAHDGQVSHAFLGPWLCNPHQQPHMLLSYGPESAATPDVFLIASSGCVVEAQNNVVAIDFVAKLVLHEAGTIA
eukprot:CAMPEP_0117690918 /NCGR_PEP_ID=MMETSP0804-20121206/25411_1 /TAXON_ID=1074897 /ORGANISM="Tetraselmis astigmatica, Strain CCMP880" /LENGTH=76 /DNA_ID=CAMNT_0005504053 /DNA_START=59 /DNA_END=286 /DNA_ORIENTATION=+